MDNHGMKFQLDTSDVAKGFRDYKSAVEGIFTSLDKFEAHVNKTMAGVAKASANPQALNAFKKAVQGFSSVDIDASAAKKLSALSAAMAGFKAPSATQATNTKKFFTSLGGMPDLTAALRSVKALASVKDAMANFKAPAASQAKNLAAFGAAAQQATPGLMALSKISGISGIANELASISIAMRNLKAPNASQVTNLGNLALALRSFNFSNLAGSGNFYAALGAISNFRAPSQGQIKNLQSFVIAVGNMKIPPNAAGVAASLNQIATAASRAGLSLGGLRAGMGGLGGSLGGVGNNAHKASLQMMGLQNAFSGTFQVGSLLRSLLGTLTIGELGRNYFEATNAALAFTAQMSVLSKETGFAALQLDYINVTANKFGMDMLGAEAGFGKISIAASKSGLTVMQTRDVFEGFSTSMAVLGVTTAGQGDVWLALQQVMNKGYLSAEELNQQLNEKLPGAMAYAGEYAKSLGVTLEKGLKTKVLDASGVLGYMAKRMKEDFGPAMATALDRPSSQMNILKNNVMMLFQEIGKAGGNTAFTDLLKSINSYLTPDAIQRYASAIGQGLKDAVDKVAGAFQWLHDNWDSIKGPLATTLDLMGRWMMVSAALQIGKYIVQPLLSIGGSLGGLRQMGLLLTAITASSNATAMAGLSGGFLSIASKVNGATGALKALNTTAMLNAAAMASVSRAQAVLAYSSTVAAGGIAGLKSVMSGLVGFLGGPWMIGLGAAAGALYLLYQHHNELTGAVDTSNRLIAESNTLIQAHAGITGTAAGGAAALGANHGAAVTPINNFAGAVGNAAAQLWNMAAAQRAASIGKFAAQIGKLNDETQTLSSNHTAGGISQQGNLSNIKGIGDLGRKLGNTALFVADNAVTGGRAEDSANAQIIKNARMIKQLRAEQKALVELPMDKWVNSGMKAITTGGGGGKPAAAGGGGGKTRKGPTVKSAEDQANSLENTVDSLMKKLTDSEPLGKLYTDFVKTLTDEAHVLLSDGGYKTFLANIKTDAADGKVTVDSLIKSLGDGGNLSAKTMGDLKKRYGEDVTGIISMLRQQQAAYENSIKDATIKSLNQTYAGVKDIISVMGDFNPVIKLTEELNTELLKLAKPALNPTAFTEYATALADGSLNGAQAVAVLTEIIDNGKTAASGFGAVLARLGITTKDYTAGVARAGAVNAYQQAQQKETATFGATLLRQRQEEITLNSLSNREAETMVALQQEVNRYVAAYGPISQTKIDSLYKELKAQQDLGDQMKRNKEHFENNGVRSYVNGLKTAGQAAQELDKNVFQSLEDQLVNLGKTGEFSFTAIFDTIQDGILRMASQNITKGITNMLFGQDKLDGGDPSLFGGMFKMFGDTGPAKAAPLGTSAINAMYVTWAGKDINVTPDGKISTGITSTSTGIATEPGTSALSPLYVTETSNALGQGNALGALPGSRSPTGQKFDEAFKDFPAASTDPKVTIDKATAATATSFSTTLGNMMPMIGMAFAGSFKSPIAQVGAMFLSMMLQQMMTSQAGGAGGGLGGILGKIGGLFGGGGGAGAAHSLGGALAGAFKEGGYTNSPVTMGSVHAGMFTNAPHYKEGTANTSGGGIPAILHDNEAVIPLSRGRKIPVEMGGAQRGQSINNNFNISSPDADSFRKSRQQIATEMHMSAGRAFRRNHG